MHPSVPPDRLAGEAAHFHRHHGLLVGCQALMGLLHAQPQPSCKEAAFEAQATRSQGRQQLRERGRQLGGVWLRLRGDCAHQVAQATINSMHRGAAATSAAAQGVCRSSLASACRQAVCLPAIPLPLAAGVLSGQITGSAACG